MIVAVNQEGSSQTLGLQRQYYPLPRIESASLDLPTYDPYDFAETDGSAFLEYSLDQSADVTIQLEALSSGQVMQTWSLPGQPAGAQEFAWSGTLESGEYVGDGEYRWRITTVANGYTSRPTSVLMEVTY